jgi:hypothetical protein
MPRLRALRRRGTLRLYGRVNARCEPFCRPRELVLFDGDVHFGKNSATPSDRDLALSMVVCLTDVIAMHD